MKYYAWIVGEEPEDDALWSYDAWDDWYPQVAEKFLDYVYSEMDGWEWMPNDGQKTVVRVQQAGSETYKDFVFEVEYRPEFYVYEKTE